MIDPEMIHKEEGNGLELGGRLHKLLPYPQTYVNTRTLAEAALHGVFGPTPRYRPQITATTPSPS
jgi:hypothetical protein